MKIDIIISTKNRADHLAHTLQSLSKIECGGLSVEVIIVDNGSKDHTQRAVSEWVGKSNYTLSYMFFDHGAKAAALNYAIERSTGEILVFTDDDLRFHPKWLMALVKPLLDDTYDAVSGGINIAPALQRKWMTTTHRLMLAENVAPKHEGDAGLIGANMAFHRRVLRLVPNFDRFLGPGAYGLGEDALFGNQLKACGARVGFAEYAEAEHHFDERRLSKQSWLQHASAYGASSAYVFHHWEHARLSVLCLRLLKKRTELFFFRLSHSLVDQSDGITAREINLVNNLAFLRTLSVERTKLRHYAFHGSQMLK